MKGSYLFDRWALLCGRVVSTAFVADVGAVLSSIVLLEEFRRNELYLYKFTFRLFKRILNLRKKMFWKLRGKKRFLFALSYNRITTPVHIFYSHCCYCLIDKKKTSKMCCTHVLPRDFAHDILTATSNVICLCSKMPWQNLTYFLLR